MKHLNAFYIIGTVGMLVTAILHITLALLLHQPSVHTTFFVLYPMFAAFLAIGFGQLLKKAKDRK